MTPGGERSRVGGRTWRSRPGGKGLGGNGLGGLVWVWLGLAWARYFALSLPTAAAAAAAGEAVSRPAGAAAAAPSAPISLSFAAVAAADDAPVARAGSAPRFRGVLGAAAWPAGAVVWPAGAAVATPRTPSSFSSAAAAAAGEALAARAGSVPRVRGVLEVAARPAEVVSWPAGVAAAAPRAPSPLFFAAVAAADEAPVARAGSAPRFRSVLVATPRAPFLLSSAAAAALGDAPGSCAGLPPVSAACRGPWSGPRRAPLPARLGGAGRRGWLPGRRGRSSRPAQAPGPAAAA